MKLKIDQNGCIGCESCEVICPTYFTMNDDSLAEVVKQPEEMNDCLEEAIESCPVDVITYG